MVVVVTLEHTLTWMWVHSRFASVRYSFDEASERASDLIRYTLFSQSFICISIRGGVLHSTFVLSKIRFWALAFSGLWRSQEHHSCVAAHLHIPNAIYS